MKKIIVLLSFSIVLTANFFAQSGEFAYKFLELPFSARSAAMGGSHAALANDGINGALANPSLLSDQTNNELAINFSSYLADVNIGSIAYGKNIKNNLLGIGIQYVDYGSFEGRDEYNQSTGTFTAKDIAISMLYAKQLDSHWKAGIALKPIFSNYENYSSFGLGVDLGLSYINIENGICAGLKFANIGQQITAYYNEFNSLPYDVIFSISEKFKHAPVRVHFTAHHLNRWDLNYTNNITKTNLGGEEETNEISNLDMLFRHTIIGLDFVPGKAFYLSTSYNHRRARELALLDVKSISGFSFGGGLKIKTFDFGFALSQYQKGIMSYQFSLSTSLNAFK